MAVFTPFELYYMIDRPLWLQRQLKTVTFCTFSFICTRLTLSDVIQETFSKFYYTI